jgi:putative ABC transport system permease protein
MPDWRALLRGRLSTLSLKPTTEMDVIEEIAQHLDDRYESLRAAGLSDLEAQAAAVAEIDTGQLLADLGDVFDQK